MRLASKLTLFLCLWSVASALLYPAVEGEDLPANGGDMMVANDRPYTYAALREDLTALSARYPSCIAVRAIGESIWGRPLHLAAIGSGSAKILLVAASHGREWMTALLLMKMLEAYAWSSSTATQLGGYNVARLLSRATLLFVPMLNPDGVDISISGLEAGGEAGFLLRANLERKDFSSWKANARGVNLNLQFEANWPLAMSKTQSHYEKYKGPAPESEPETRALANLVRKEKPDLVLTYHSSGRLIYWYYYQTGAAYRRDRALVERIAKLTGYKPAMEDKYNRHAGLKDWFVLTFKRPAFTIEIGAQADGRALPLEALDEVWADNATTPLDMAKWLTDKG